MNKTTVDIIVRMNPVDNSKIVQAVLTRDDCGSILALCHSAGNKLGDRNEHLKAYFSDIMQIVPKSAEGDILCPIPAEVAASVLSICYLTDFLGKKSDKHLVWVDSVKFQLEKALHDAQIRVKIEVDGKLIFSSPVTTTAGTHIL